MISDVNAYNCPNCGAPVAWKEGQTLALCMYCNSSLRATPASRQELAGPSSPGLLQVDVPPPPAVIDEVKRLIVIGKSILAAEYYSQQTGVSAQEAEQAVAAIRKQVGYRPSLNCFGMLMLSLIILASLSAVLYGGYLFARTRSGPGIVLILAGLLFGFANISVFASSVRATWLTRFGLPAQATILNRWKVMDTSLHISRLRGQRTPIQLLRLLLEVRSLDGSGPAYITEANCMVGEKSQLKFQVGQVVTVKVDPRDRSKVVVV